MTLNILASINLSNFYPAEKIFPATGSEVPYLII